ncbi:hypothetical protein [Cyanobium sp. Morenito 9A2]|uniref:hypothetical protein n=1 Tax=Cyanobium sp. Morenito 9A2 TaxID=2823718 RepID=UPI0020CD81D0|nr:hypothetical protein [Cyanobium sp. Morenito 9A2]MCP9850563.1 hypothetical protein [Cyanobium sp. Morenito 9A2]
MAWDPALLRKYNATGHFRLLSQLRSELKAHPLTRAADDLAAGVRPSRRVRGLEPRSSGQQGGRYRRSASQLSMPVEMTPLALNDPYGFDADGNSSASSFRDRLNAIDMR